MVSLRLGSSEITGAVLILVISVVLSVALLALFINYINNSLQSLYSGPLGYHCEFTVIGYAMNDTAGTYEVALALYNYGSATCIINGAAIINATTGNVIMIIPYSSPIKFSKFTIVTIKVNSIKPPFIIRFYANDGYTGDAIVE
ncbi:hypothetical protein [Caldivirga maquilingensis]|uniref:Flagellin n=1 Tax=Caldivirga maquilingensis (strain ATCC 700844 / DSM 13496 / JCM 10307 / IC-167) TaxID=397948 RepID=A8MBS1_CALMQ|nr:hypothetical protein [Caldivirga maquilingensis]ABW01264.1 hypothetical protein Cmaq_0419 [Caldivirga maquilingensis IC-167]